MVAPQCETVCGGPSAAATAAQLVLLRSSGEVEFDGLGSPELFVFTQVADETHPLTLAGAVLNPLSSDFVMSSPGALQYVGAATKRFYASWATTFLWGAATGGVTDAIFFGVLMKNGAVLGKTTSGSLLNINTDNVFGHSAETLVELAPGDILQVGISVVLLTGITYTIAVSAMTLVAHEA